MTSDTTGSAPTPEVLDEAKEEALDFLEGLLDAMDADGEVDAEIIDGQELYLTISGGDAGLLIGRRGQTLDAIQDLVRTTVGRQAETRIRMVLDIEGYRDRRRQSLQEEARTMAERALAEGEVELEPMTAYERKIVHDAIAEIDGVTSFSEGEDPRRRVILKAETE